MPEFYTVEITNDSIRRQVAKSPTRRLDFVVDVNEDGEQEVVGFVYAKGRLVADDVAEAHLRHFRATPDFLIEGETEVFRTSVPWTHAEREEAERQKRTLGAGTLPSDSGELKEILAATLKLLGNQAPTTGAASVTRTQIKEAKLDEEAHFALVDLLESEGLEASSASQPEIIKLYATVAKFAKANAVGNAAILEIIEDSSVRAELSVFAEPAEEVVEVNTPAEEPMVETEEPAVSEPAPQAEPTAPKPPSLKRK